MFESPVPELETLGKLTLREEDNGAEEGTRQNEEDQRRVRSRLALPVCVRLLHPKLSLLSLIFRRSWRDGTMRRWQMKIIRNAVSLSSHTG